MSSRHVLEGFSDAGGRGMPLGASLCAQVSCPATERIFETAEQVPEAEAGALRAAVCPFCGSECELEISAEAFFDFHGEGPRQPVIVVGRPGVFRMDGDGVFRAPLTFDERLLQES